MAKSILAKWLKSVGQGRAQELRNSKKIGNRMNTQTLEGKQSLIIRQQTIKKISDIDLIRVNSNATLMIARDTLVELTQIEKNIKAQEQKISKPLQVALKANRAFFSPLTAKAKKAKDILKSKMLVYSNKIDAQKTKKEIIMAYKVGKGELSVSSASKKLEKIEARAEAVPVRIVRKVEITDKRKVPVSYWVLDLVKIRKDALAGVGIPGVKVVEEKTIVSK